MKKIIMNSMVFLLVFSLVACGGTSNTVEIENVEITSNVLEADFKLKVDYETHDELYELVTSAVYLTYDHHKDTIGTRLFTLYFTVYEKDSDTPLGVISYQVNSSLESPGLNYMGDNLTQEG